VHGPVNEVAAYVDANMVALWVSKMY